MPTDPKDREMVEREGWKLVPTDTTRAMEEAASLALIGDTHSLNGHVLGRNAYLAMLAAAPTPTTGASASGEVEQVLLVEGPVHEDENGDWNAEVQLIGGHEIVADFYGAEKAKAVAMRRRFLDLHHALRPSPQDERVARLEELARRVLNAPGADNALDVEVEVALFESDDTWTAIRPNAAGTKVICTTPSGSECTFCALDYTVSERSRQIHAERLLGRAALSSAQDRGATDADPA